MAIPNEPLTRVEQYLNNIAVGEGTIPEEPLTRVELYLDEIAKNGGGGDPEAIASAVTGWLEENVDPVGSAVVVDSSLSVEGAAADAKATGDEIGDLKSAFSEVDEALFDYSKNVYDQNTQWANATFVNGILTEKTSGKNDAATVDFIPVTPHENWTISWEKWDLPTKLYVEAYTTNKTWISQIVTNATMNIVTGDVTFTTPSTCAFIRMRIYRSGDNAWDTIIPAKIQIEQSSTPTSYEPHGKESKIIGIEEEISELQADVENNPALTQRKQVQSDINLLGTLIVGYLKDDGTFSPMSAWRRSDYIPVTPGMFMYFYNISPYAFFGFFNDDKEWIGGKNIETPVTLHSAMLVVHTIPANAAYMIVSLEAEKAETCWGNYTPTIPTGNIIYANKETLRAYEMFPENPCDFNGMDVCAFRSGICIGDSITGGGFNYSSGTNPWRDGNVYSYPSQFQKMTGIPMTNEGHSGLTTVQWWNTYGTGGASEIDFSGHDFAIIHLGINDVSYSVDIEDTETAYQNIINALKSANEGIKIFVCTIIPAYADAENLSPYAAVNALVSSFASQKNVYCCDLTTYGHEYTVSEYTAGHLTAYGYWRMAKDLIAYIGYIMRQKPWEFRFIQFIGTDMEYTPGQ